MPAAEEKKRHTLWLLLALCYMEQAPVNGPGGEGIRYANATGSTCFDFPTTEQLIAFERAGPEYAITAGVLRYKRKNTPEAIAKYPDQPEKMVGVMDIWARLDNALPSDLKPVSEEDIKERDRMEKGCRNRRRYTVKLNVCENSDGVPIGVLKSTPEIDGYDDDM